MSEERAEETSASIAARLVSYKIEHDAPKSEASRIEARDVINRAELELNGRDLERHTLRARVADFEKRLAILKPLEDAHSQMLMSFLTEANAAKR